MLPKEAGSRVRDAARSHLPKNVLRMSGRALYSPASTLCSESPFYFLGINPTIAKSGNEYHGRLSIDEDLERLANDQIRDHGYIDERWGDKKERAAPMQRNGQKIFEILCGGNRQAGLDLFRKTPVSNVMLVRSDDEKDLLGVLGSNQNVILMRMWRFHQIVIDIKKPRFVITHAIGKTKAALLESNVTPCVYKSGMGGSLGYIYVWPGSDGPTVIALPNLSRYQPSGGRADALEAVFRDVGAMHSS